MFFFSDVNEVLIIFEFIVGYYFFLVVCLEVVFYYIFIILGMYDGVIVGKNGYFVLIIISWYCILWFCWDQVVERVSLLVVIFVKMGIRVFFIIEDLYFRRGFLDCLFIFVIFFVGQIEDFVVVIFGNFLFQFQFKVVKGFFSDDVVIIISFVLIGSFVY